MSPAWLLGERPPERPGLLLRQMLASEPVIVAPGVFNPLVGVLARQMGFPVLYVSGGALAASLALPDLGLFTLTDLAQEVRAIYRATASPLIVDADTGFGEVLNVVMTVVELEHAGAAAIQLEDQRMPKKCGHLPGKVVIPPEEMVQKIRAAVRVRRDALIIARTDARATHGLEEVIRRARLYAEAGADVIFPEALESEEEFKEVARNVDVPLLANMTEFGKTPYFSVEQFREWGYRIVIFPVTALRMAMAAVSEALAVLRRDGSQKALLARMQTRQQLYDLIGYDTYVQFDAELARSSFRSPP
jgi:methylisocitrate lyase